jgi:type IV pilus assembly protein PilQ
MKRVDNLMVKNTGILLTSLFLALGIALFGCGPKQSMSVAPEPQPQVTSESAAPAATETDPAAKAFSLVSEGKRTLIELSIAEQVDVSPEYMEKSLKLSFSPALSGITAEVVSPGGLVSDISVVPGPVSGTTQALIFRLKEESQFLISRPQPDLLKILLAIKDPQVAPEVPAAPAAKATEHLLSGIDFSNDKDGMFYIKMKADGGLDYFPRSGKEGQMRLIFPELNVPAGYAKLYRLHKFNLGVRSAMLQNTAEGAELVLAMDSRRPMSVERKDGEMVLKFQGTPGSVPLEENPKPTVVSVNSPAAVTPDQQLEEFNTLFPGMKTQYTGTPCSINLQNAEVEHVLRLICEVSGYNLILDDDVTGRISLKLDSVPWDQALDLVLLQRDLGVVTRGNIMRVASKTKLQREQADIQKARRAALEAQEAMKTLAPLHTEFIQINYTTAGEIMPKVNDFLTERGRVTFDQRTNMLIVNATAAQIESIRSVIEKLDRPERQVLIEARVVYATDQFQRAMGIKWGGGYANTSSDQFSYEGYGAASQGPNNNLSTDGQAPHPSGYAVNLPASLVNTGLGFTWAKLAGNNLFVLDTQLQLAEEKNLSKVISSPRIVTLNNQQAEIRQGTLVRADAESESGGTTIEYKEAVLKLIVKPQITPDSRLILELDISDDAPEGNDISTRSAKTKLLVNDGETIVIGGVLRTTETNNQARTPGLHKVPVFGNLFKNRNTQDNKEELLIFIRPKVL